MPMIINGTPENDNFIGTAGDDSITGAGGNDTLNGGLGNDTLLGGIGDDLITFGAGQKIIDGGAGIDALVLDFADETEDFILTYNRTQELVSITEGGILDGTEIAGIEQIEITSGSGNDLVDIAVTSVGGRITSGAGNDTVIGGRGDDLLEGESGDDTFFGGPGNDEIDGGAGNDASVYFGLRSDYVVAIDEDGTAMVTGIALEDFSEPGADLSRAEVFTDNLTDIELILFDDGEIIVETGEFIAFEAGTETDGLDVVIGGGIDAEEIPVFEFFRTDTQTQFYTTSEDERDFIVDNLPQYQLEGISFVGVAPPEAGEDITGLSPVYRFFNTNSGVHLYTADENERAFIEANLDNYNFEGTPYFGFTNLEAGTVPVYRFRNASLDAHFYTTSAAERDLWLDSPDYQLEGGADGIAFYVEPATEV